MRRLLPLPVSEVNDLWDLYRLPPQPHLRLGFVQSLDGALAVDGSSRPLSGPADRVALRTLRATADVVLVGAGTARAEDYGPLPLPEALRRRREDDGMRPRPVLAVLTTDPSSLDPQSRLLSDPAGRVTIVTTATATSRLPDHIEVLALGGEHIDVAAALGALRERHGPRLLCEGGPDLARQLLSADLVDELCLTLSPQLAGGPTRLLPEALQPGRALQLLSLVEQDGELLSRWSLRPS